MLIQVAHIALIFKFKFDQHHMLDVTFVQIWMSSINRLLSAKKIKSSLALHTAVDPTL